MSLVAVSGFLFVVGLAGLLYLLKPKNRTNIQPNVCIVGLNDKNENKEFLFNSEIETTLQDVLKPFLTNTDKFYSDPQKINVLFNGQSLLIHDHNIKNMLFINKRRLRKTTLKDGDLIEFGNLKLMFLNSATANKFDGMRSRLKLLNNKNLKQKIPEHLPRLVSFDNHKKTTVLSKNLTYIGKSETNDIILKIKDVSFKHAVVKRISGKYKLVDLNSKNGTYINGKRYDEKFLNSGDEIAFDTAKFRIIYPTTAKAVAK